MSNDISITSSLKVFLGNNFAEFSIKICTLLETESYVLKEETSTRYTGK